MISKTTEESTS